MKLTAACGGESEKALLDVDHRWLWLYSVFCWGRCSSLQKHYKLVFFFFCLTIKCGQHNNAKFIRCLLMFICQCDVDHWRKRLYPTITFHPPSESHSEPHLEAGKSTGTGATGVKITKQTNKWTKKTPKHQLSGVVQSSVGRNAQTSILEKLNSSYTHK